MYINGSFLLYYKYETFTNMKDLTGFNINELTVGSTVFLILNNKKEVKGIEPVFDKTSTGGESNTNLNSSRRIAIGYVNRKKGSIISIGYTAPNVIDERFDCLNTPVIVVDETEKDKVSLGSIADIVSYEEEARGYSKVAIQTVQMSQKMIVVYK